MSDDSAGIRARILTMVPAEQLPFLEFELRMLATTLEAENLRYIHQHWRPIAAERDQLRSQLATAQAAIRTAREPRGRGGKDQGDDDAATRLKALEAEHKLLQRNHTNQRERYDALKEEHASLKSEYEELEGKVAKLEKDLHELLGAPA